MNGTGQVHHSRVQSKTERRTIDNPKKKRERIFKSSKSVYCSNNIRIVSDLIYCSSTGVRVLKFIKVYKQNSWANTLNRNDHRSNSRSRTLLFSFFLNYYNIATVTKTYFLSALDPLCCLLLSVWIIVGFWRPASTAI